MAKYKIPTLDYNGDSSTIILPVADAITDPNITTLFTSVQAIILVNEGQTVLVTEANKNLGPGGKPANGEAQREKKWLCRYHDATTQKKYVLELPGADLSKLAPASEFLDITAGDGLTFKNQFDAFVVAPDTANAVVLDEVQFVGRNI